MKFSFTVDKGKFDKKGFLLIKNVFSKAEIEQMRKDAYAELERWIPGFLKKKEQREGATLFMTSALKLKHWDQHWDRYIQKIMMDCQDHMDYLLASRFDPNVLELTRQKNLEVIKIIPGYGTLE
jgi:hypothetical protein